MPNEKGNKNRRGQNIVHRPSERSWEECYEKQLDALTLAVLGHSSKSVNLPLQKKPSFIGYSLGRLDGGSKSTISKEESGDMSMSIASTHLVDLSNSELDMIEEHIANMDNIENGTNGGSELDDSEPVSLRLCEFLSLLVSIILIIVTFPLSMLVCCRSIRVYERMVILRMGRILKSNPVGPGLAFVLPCIDNTTKLDLRLDYFTIPPTDIMLQDSIQVRIEAVVWYRIINPLSAVAAVEDHKKSTKLLSVGVIRRFLGYKSLNQVIQQERTFIGEIQHNINMTTMKFGVKVERVELRTIQLQEKFQRIIAAEGTAYATAKSRPIMTKGELNSAPLLASAGEGFSKTCLQIRYMQTLNSIQSKTELGSTLIYPVPLDFGIKNLVEHGKKMREKNSKRPKGQKAID